MKILPQTVSMNFLRGKRSAKKQKTQTPYERYLKREEEKQRQKTESKKIYPVPIKEYKPVDIDFNNEYYKSRIKDDGVKEVEYFDDNKALICRSLIYPNGCIEDTFYDKNGNLISKSEKTSKNTKSTLLDEDGTLIYKREKSGNITTTNFYYNTATPTRTTTFNSKTGAYTVEYHPKPPDSAVIIDKYLQ